MVDSLRESGEEAFPVKILCALSSVALGVLAVDVLLGVRTPLSAASLAVLGCSLAGYMAVVRRLKSRAFQSMWSAYAERELRH